MNGYEFLQTIWYLLIGVLFIGYSILDGFDLGIGCLSPWLARDERERRALFNVVGPVWDGNEVWLLTGGGALFAAFPPAYATVFSGFYLALMLLLFALIMRAVSLEFRHFDPSRRGVWYAAFVVGSALPALLLGVALGNVMVGIPLDVGGDFTGTFFTLLRPYPLLIGLLGLTAFLLQGCTYAAHKCEGAVQQRARRGIVVLGPVFMGLFLLAGAATFLVLPGTFGRLPAWSGAVTVVTAWILLRVFSRRGEDRLAFWMSSLQFIGLWAIVGAVHFPFLVRAGNDTALSLTLYNSSSSPLTLRVMLLIALLGMPLVLGYTWYVYRLFHGKVQVPVAEEEHG